MSDSVSDLLAKRNMSQPPEIQVIKEFLNKHYQASCRVTLRTNQIIVEVNSAALAGSLRLRLHELQSICNTTKRLVIRIGS